MAKLPGDRGAQTGDRLEDTMKQKQKAIRAIPLGKSSTEEVHEDISRNGIGYLTLKGAMHRLRRDDGIVHFALTGGAEGMSLAVAKRLCKELKKNQYFEKQKILVRSRPTNWMK